MLSPNKNSQIKPSEMQEISVGPFEFVDGSSSHDINDLSPEKKNS